MNEWDEMSLSERCAVIAAMNVVPEKENPYHFACALYMLRVEPGSWINYFFKVNLYEIEREFGKLERGI